MWLDGPVTDDFGRDYVFRVAGFPYPGLILADPDLNVLARTQSDASAEATLRTLQATLRERPDLAPHGQVPPPVLNLTDPAQAAFAALQNRYKATIATRRPVLIAPLQAWLAAHAAALPDVAAIARTLLADALYAAGEFGPAEALWRDIIRLHPQHPLQHRAAFNLKDKLSWPEMIHPTLQGLPLPGVALHPPEVPYPEVRAANLARVAADPQYIRAPFGHLFVRIAPGTFTMGGVSEPMVHRNERPLRRVTLTRSFLFGAFQVTRAQWRLFRPDDWPGAESAGLAGELPHARVSWLDAEAYCAWLTEHGDGWRYRLPTEAEWEWAARGGIEGARFPWGDAPLSPERANYSLPRPVPVGSYPPNAYGVFETLGNGAEHCSDRYRPDAYALTPYEVTDPQGPTAEEQPGDFRAIRGSVLGSPFGEVIAYVSWRGLCNIHRVVGGSALRIVAEPPED